MVTGTQVKSLTPAARAVLDAAGRLFYGQGINAVGVDTVAAEAGVTKKTLYDQFGSKAALVVAYLTERDQHFRTWVEQKISERDGSARILAVFDALDYWMDSHCPKGCAFVHAHGELLGSPDHPAHEVIRTEKLWFHQLFENLAREADHGDPTAIATQLVALLEGATVLRSISDLPAAVAESRKAAAVLMRTAQGATADAPEAF